MHDGTLLSKLGQLQYVTSGDNRTSDNGIISKELPNSSLVTDHNAPTFISIEGVRNFGGPQPAYKAPPTTLNVAYGSETKKDTVL